MTTLSLEVDAAVLAKATDDLAMGGLTVEEAVNIFLRRIAKEQVEPEELMEDSEGYDAWLRAKVQDALDSTEPSIPHEEVMAEMDRLIDDTERASPQRASA